MTSLLQLANVDQVEATLLFSNAKIYRWLGWCLKDGFSHIRIVVHKPTCDIVVDPRIGYTEVDAIAKGSSFDGLFEHKVTVKRNVPIMKHRGVFGFLNCVEQAKMYLGIKKWWILTPYQLYKELKNG